jgi:hypothetical protein
MWVRFPPGINFKIGKRIAQTGKMIAGFHPYRPTPVDPILARELMSK